MAGGRAQERERFVRDFLRHHEARLIGPPRGPCTAELPPALARRLGSERLDLVFRPAELAEHPGAQLMVPGHRLFDRLLRLARRGGGASRRYQKPDHELKARARGADGAEREERGEPGQAAAGDWSYRPELLFTFRVAYRSFDAWDDIRSLVVTRAEAGAFHVREGKDFFRDRNLVDEPEPGIDPPAEIDIAAALRAALAELERRIHPEVARFRQRADLMLKLESERLLEFYSALIAEEKVRRDKRGSTSAVAASECKVEWVQRVDREKRLFAPKVTVTLLGLEEVWVPEIPGVGEGANGAAGAAGADGDGKPTRAGEPGDTERAP
jgi:hypothetical protein